jgi:hypothetical protein
MPAVGVVVHSVQPPNRYSHHKEKTMSSKLQATLYVASIVVAIGIGLSQVGVERNIGGASECKQGTQTSDCPHDTCGQWSECKTVTSGTGADSCTQEPNSACYADNGPSVCRSLVNRKSDAETTFVECDTE